MKTHDLILFLTLTIFLNIAHADAHYFTKPLDVIAAVPDEFAPQYSTDKEGNSIGFAIDVMDEVARIANLRVTYRKEDSWSNVNKALLDGRADLIPNLGITVSRQNVYAFTYPVETFPVAIFVRSSMDHIKNEFDLAGHKVAVVRFNVAVALMQKRKDVETLVFETVNDALFALLSSEVDAIVYPLPVIKKIIETTGLEESISVAEGVVTEIKRGIAVRKDDKLLHARLNSAVQQFVNSPRYGEIYKKWHVRSVPYWTVDKVFWVMSGVLVLIIILAAVWRYASLIKHNRQLKINIEQRQQVETSLRKSDALLKESQKIAHLGSWELDLLTNEIIWSDEVYQIFGLPQDGFAATYEGFVERIHPDDREAAETAYTDSVRKGEDSYSFTHRIVRHDTGIIRVVHEKCRHEKDADGKIIRSIGMIQDITEWEKVGEENRTYAELFKKWKESSFVGVISSNDAGDILDANEAVLGMLGYSRHDVEDGKLNRNKLTPEEYRQLDNMALEEAERTGKFAPFEKELIHKDGHRVPIMIGGSLIKRHPSEYIVFVVNITERRQQERQLESLNKLLNGISVIENAYISEVERDILFDDVLGFILDITESEYGFIGEVIYDHEAKPYLKTLAVTNIAWNDETKLFYENNVEKGLEFHNLETLFGEVMVKEEPVIANDPQSDPRSGGLPAGPPPLNAFLGIPVSAGDKLVGMMGVANKSGGYDQVDIEFLQPLLKSFGTIISAIRIKDENKLHEEILRRTQKMEAVGQLTGGIAHDFNNILGIIQGNLNLLERQLSSKEKTSKRIDTLKISTQRAIDLTKQLLGFSRNKVSQTSSVSLNELIEGMASMIMRALTPDILLEEQLDSDLGLSDIDPGDFENALLNLTINARDAMDGRGKLIIKTSNQTLDESYCGRHPGAKPGDYVQLSIIDDGHGISSELQDRIFEPFFTTKPEGKGTGLGLSMVFGFIKRCGGYIHVDSEVGVGTNFNLYLPRTQQQVIPDTSKQPEPTNNSHDFTGSGTILVVDDETALVSLAQSALESIGYKVVTATDGNAALKKLDEYTDVDLVFTDIMMPGGMNGYELAEKAIEEYPEIKILLTTGYTKNIEVTPNEAILASPILEKPYTLEQLASEVRTLLAEV